MSLSALRDRAQPRKRGRVTRKRGRGLGREGGGPDAEQYQSAYYLDYPHETDEPAPTLLTPHLRL